VIEKRYRFIFSKQAQKFLERNAPRLTRDEAEAAVVKAIRRITHEEINSADVIPMKGQYKGYFRVRIGTVRIVFAYLDGDIRIVDIDTIDFRGSVYH
jgi:mRNA interferase RelE/StbE